MAADLRQETLAATGGAARAKPLLSVSDLVVRFRVRHGVVHAVNGISFEIAHGETLGLVGESGSGKSTTGFTLIRRYEPAEGQIVFDGEDLTHMRGEALRRMREHMQVVFQDPYASLNPRMKVGDLIAEPLLVHGRARPGPALAERVRQLLQMCGLPAEAMEKLPTAFSGGERQRIAIARALALTPKLIIADEVVSALDVSIKAQIINLLVALQQEHGLSYLFISHDLAVVRNIAHRIVILYAGQVMESGPTESIFSQPRHPYTAALICASPVADPVVERTRKRIVIAGDVPSVMDPPAGCPFHSRCPLAIDRCIAQKPPLELLSPKHSTACWRSNDVATLADARLS